MVVAVERRRRRVRNRAAFCHDAVRGDMSFTFFGTAPGDAQPLDDFINLVRGQRQRCGPGLKGYLISEMR
jgi:hypothetical protein